MKIRLVKQVNKADENEQPVQKPSATQILLTARSWVDEFKSRKDRPDLSLLEPSRQVS